MHKLCTLGLLDEHLNQTIYGEDLVVGRDDFGLDDARNLSDSLKEFVGLDTINGSFLSILHIHKTTKLNFCKVL